MKTADKAAISQDLGHLLKRGVAEIIVAEEMVKLLHSGKKLRLKEGFDPSFPAIHLGHMVALRKLRQFQELGHQVILIVGDWTAQIGDPSGVSITRPMLSAEQVKANAETYMQQFFKIVDKHRTEVRWQSEWFGKFTLADIIRLTSKFTVAQFLARDDFSKRYKEGRPIAITELLYPLLQAYDSVVVQADVEFGGIDQKFNFLVGRELQSTEGQRPQQCLMTPLLVGTDGSHKMSKSLGNYIGVAEPPEEIYGKVMSIPDSLILQYFELVTDVPDKELEEFRQQMNNETVNPMILKKRLALKIVTGLYSQEEATEAEEHFAKVFQKRKVPEELEEFRTSLNERKFEWEEGAGIDFSRLLVDTGMVKSRSEANRLISQGSTAIDGIKVTNNIVPIGSSSEVSFELVEPGRVDDGKKISSNVALIRSGSIIKVGKRRWVKLIDAD